MTTYLIDCLALHDKIAEILGPTVLEHAEIITDAWLDEQRHRMAVKRFWYPGRQRV